MLIKPRGKQGFLIGRVDDPCTDLLISRLGVLYHSWNLENSLAPVLTDWSRNESPFIISVDVLHTQFLAIPVVDNVQRQLTTELKIITTLW